MIVGLFLKTGGYLEGFRSTTLVGINLIVYGILLGISDYIGKEVKSFEDMSWRDGLIVGIAQALNRALSVLGDNHFSKRHRAPSDCQCK